MIDPGGRGLINIEDKIKEVSGKWVAIVLFCCEIARRSLF